MLVMHVMTGKVANYVPWDEVFSMKDRFFHTCPVCGIGVCSPIKGPPMAHRRCLEEVERKRKESEATNGG